MNGVDAFLDSLAHPLRAEIDRVRALIVTAVPSLDEHVKWKAPSFKAGGDDCVTLKLYPPKAVQVVFHRGAKVKDKADLKHLDPDGLLKWAASDRGVAQFTSLEDIDNRADAFKALVTRWVAATSS
ncbi:DUF1801 domain-containing protein [Pelagibacterium limicola]|uniref:DUF1801 domain-containing protein n=1 Tax=Pelagibacterium limicola TaxID=2791022 RepID=UPI0018AFFF55|nr:DUF1801 domain-containing protein [Pelagibacterium limicola]